MPEDVSVVGFDDTFAKYLTPPLTTVRQPMFEMGFQAASLAMDMVAGESTPPPTARCSTTLVVRESTGAAAGVRR